MRKRVLAILLLILAGFGASTLPAPVHAASGDQAYTAKLQPILHELVTAAQKVQTGGNDITGGKWSAAAKQFGSSLTIYKTTQLQVNALHPTVRMNKVQHLLQLSVASYITGVTDYLNGSNSKNVNQISAGVKPYNQGTKYLNQAAAAIRKATP